MAKWRVEKRRDYVDWVAPWSASHPLGFTYYFQSWDIAMSYVNMRVMTNPLARKKIWNE